MSSYLTLPCMALAKTLDFKPLCTQLYSPSRGIRPQDLPSLAEEAAQNIKGYGNLLVPSLVDIEDMLSDTGAVVQKAS